MLLDRMPPLRARHSRGHMAKLKFSHEQSACKRSILNGTIDAEGQHSTTN
jgi:hypothetical protein